MDACAARYSPSNFCSQATNLPNDGDIILKIKTVKVYHKIIIVGPYHPSYSDNFYVNKIISKIGFFIIKLL